MKNIINQFVVTDDEVVEYLEQFSTPEITIIEINKLLSIGVAVMKRVNVQRDVEFVRNEFTLMTEKFNASLLQMNDEMTKRIDGLMKDKFSPDIPDSYIAKMTATVNNYFGNFNKEINSLIATTKTNVSEKQNEIGKSLNDIKEKLNPELETSYLGKLKSAVSILTGNLVKELDTNNVSSFASKLKKDTAYYFGEDSPILGMVSGIIAQYTQSVNNELISLRETIAKKEGENEMLLATTRKGFIFEDEVEKILDAHASSFNDVVERTGTSTASGSQSKKGDFLYTSSVSKTTFIVEAKDATMGLKAMLTYLNQAMVDRNLPYAILVVKERTQLPNQVGLFGFYDDNKIICDIANLEIAIRWISLYAVKMKVTVIEGVDKNAIEVATNKVAEKLKEFVTMKRKMTTIENSVSSGFAELKISLDGIKSTIEESIDEVLNQIQK